MAGAKRILLKMRILVTGGTGFIGSHTVVELLHAGHEAEVLDNLSNSSEVSLRRVAELAGQAEGEIPFHRADIRDRATLERIFSQRHFDAVIHFAGLKAVGESTENHGSIMTTTSPARSR